MIKASIIRGIIINKSERVIACDNDKATIARDKSSMNTYPKKKKTHRKQRRDFLGINKRKALKFVTSEK